MLRLCAGYNMNGLVITSLLIFLLAPVFASAADIPDGVKWTVAGGDATTATTASCFAVPPQLHGDKPVAPDMNLRLVFSREKNGKDVNQEVTLTLSMAPSQKMLDEMVRLDDIPATKYGDTTLKVTQTINLAEIRQRLLSVKTIAFTVADKKASLPTSVLLDTLARLDACATLKQAK